MLVKNFFGLVKMTFGLVDVGYSLPEGQAVELIFFAPWSQLILSSIVIPLLFQEYKFDLAYPKLNISVH